MSASCSTVQRKRLDIQSRQKYSSGGKQQCAAIITNAGRLSLEVTAYPRSYARIKTIRIEQTPTSLHIHSDRAVTVLVHRPYPLRQGVGHLCVRALPYLTPSTESLVLCCDVSAAQHGDHDTWRRPPANIPACARSHLSNVRSAEGPDKPCSAHSHARPGESLVFSPRW